MDILVKSFLITTGSSAALVFVLTALFSLASRIRQPKTKGDARYLDSYENRVEYTDDDKKRFIQYLTPPGVIPAVGAGMVLVSAPFAALLDALYRLLHSYSKYPMDKTLSLTIGTAVCAALGMGLILYYLYIRFYRIPSLMNKVGRTTELGVLISDYKNGRHISSDRLVFGHRYIIPKGKGLAVKYSEIAALKMETSSIKGWDVTCNLFIEKKPEDLAERGGRVYIINEDTTSAKDINELVDAVRMYAPDAEIDV